MLRLNKEKYYAPIAEMIDLIGYIGLTDEGFASIIEMFGDVSNDSMRTAAQIVLSLVKHDNIHRWKVEEIMRCTNIAMHYACTNVSDDDLVSDCVEILVRLGFLYDLDPIESLRHCIRRMPITGAVWFCGRWA